MVLGRADGDDADNRGDLSVRRPGRLKAPRVSAFLVGSGNIQLHPVECGRRGPGRRSQTSATDSRSGLVVHVNAGAGQVAAGWTRQADLQRRSTFGHDRRGDVPHGQARVV